VRPRTKVRPIELSSNTITVFNIHFYTFSWLRKEETELLRPQLLSALFLDATDFIRLDSTGVDLEELRRAPPFLSYYHLSRPNILVSPKYF